MTIHEGSFSPLRWVLGTKLRLSGLQRENLHLLNQLTISHLPLYQNLVSDGLLSNKRGEGS